MNIFYSNRVIWLIGISLAMACALPYIVLGENTYIQIHDYLDLTIPHIKSIKDNNLFWDFNGIVPIMCGLKRSLFNFVSPVDLRIIFFMILPSYWAIVANIIFVKLFAFIGMYYLLAEHVMSKQSSKVIICISIAFSIIPFYVDYGLSSSGIPLVLYAFFNLFKERKLLISYIVVLFYGLNSILALSGLFVCVVVAVFIITSFFINHKLSVKALYGLILLSIIYIIINYDLFLNFFIGSSDYVSHREEFNLHVPFFDLIKGMCKVMLFSQYHAGAFLAFPVILFSLYICVKKNRILREEKSFRYYLIGYFVFCLMCFVLTSLKLFDVRLFKTFQFDRLYFLYPTVAFVMFAKTLDAIELKKHHITLMLFLLCCCTSYYNEEFIWQIEKIVFKQNDLKPSYKEFYDEKLFSEVKNSMINIKGSAPKVVCLGIFPAAVQYNGIWTLDASLNNYPLSHKHKFSAVLKNETSKNLKLFDYFEKWGCRCYLFSAELYSLGQKGYICSKKDNRSVKHFSPDVSALKDLECDFILSAVKIENINEIEGIEFVDYFEQPDSYRHIYLYKVL